VINSREHKVATVVPRQHRWWRRRYTEPSLA